MKRLSTAVDDVRSGRKRFSISGSLLLFLLLSVMSAAQSNARPQTTNETTTAAAAVAATTSIKTDSGVARVALQKSDASYNDDSAAELAFDAGDEYADVDNVEWHHVKIVDGVMHEDHPIIMYKEDFVSEDYDPTQHASASNSEISSQLRRMYKNIKRQNRLNHTEPLAASTATTATTEKYHALKPEKMYFDILPQSPVVVTDDSSSNDSKLDATRIHVEVISLLDEQNEAAKSESESPSKQLLNKHPKKYHHRRLRRDLHEQHEQHEQAAGHVLHKRAPHYTYERQGSNSFDDYAKHLISHWGQKHPVAGNRWNGIDGDVPPVVDFGNRFGGDDNTDRVVWGVKRTSRPAPAPAPTSRPAKQPNFPPLIHNSNPGDADFSHFTTRRPQNNFNNNNNNRPATRRPAAQPQFPPLIHNSNPNDADFSAFTRPPARRTTTPPTTTTRRPSANAISTGGDATVSQCVWAIVNCCSTSDSNIRYDCFERLGCRGAFWNLNPCADDVKDNVLDFVDQQFQSKRK